jgi:hypothetical protein
LRAKYPFLACTKESPRSDLGVDFCFGGLDLPHQILVGGLKKPIFYEKKIETKKLPLTSKFALLILSKVFGF